MKFKRKKKGDFPKIFVLNFAKKSNHKETRYEAEISVPEVVEIFNEIQQSPEELFEMIRFGIKPTVGEYDSFAGYTPVLSGLQ